MKERHIIAAVDNNFGIGNKGNLLYRISGDLQRFKNLTINNIVIMGRKTYESIGKPLPNRHNIVVSSYIIDDDVYTVQTLDEAYELAETLDGEKVFVIGGGQLYEAALNYTHILDITMIYDSAKEVDTYFPKLDMSQWHQVTISDTFTTNENISYAFITYERSITVS